MVLKWVLRRVWEVKCMLLQQRVEWERDCTSYYFKRLLEEVITSVLKVY